MAKQKPKNRGKAYKPKTAKTRNMTLEMQALSGFYGMQEYLENESTLKKHHLEMSWDLKNVDITIDLYCLMNGIKLNAKQPIPLKVLQSAYKGDLIIALRKNLIPDTQGFKITITSKARRFDDPSVIVPVETYTADFSNKPIDYSVFMLGEEKGKYYYKRDGLFNTVWQGITKEWKRDLDRQYSDDYEIFDSYATLSCETTFNSVFSESIFNKLKREMQKREAELQQAKSVA